MSSKQKKLTFFINSSCIAGNITRSLRWAESLLVHQLPADRWMLWDCILQAMWHRDVKGLKSPILKTEYQQLQQIYIPIFLFAIQNSWSTPKNVAYFQEYLLYNSVQSTPETVQPLVLAFPWSPGGHTYIYAHHKKEMKAKRTPTRNRYLFHLYTCHLHWEQSVLPCCDSS